jgi:hypothetical protein
MLPKLKLGIVAASILAMSIAAPAGAEDATPPSHDFGNVKVGATSAPFTFTLTRGSTCGGPVPQRTVVCPLSMQRVIIPVQASGDFDVVGGTCSTLGPTPQAEPTESTCTAIVVFKPTAPGRRAGTLINQGSSASLSGTGTGHCSRRHKKKHHRRRAVKKCRKA